MLRLEHENKMLKLKSNGDDDDSSSMLQSMLDDSNSRKNELETELRYMLFYVTKHDGWF